MVQQGQQSIKTSMVILLSITLTLLFYGASPWVTPHFEGTKVLLWHFCVWCWIVYGCYQMLHGIHRRPLPKWSLILGGGYATVLLLSTLTSLDPHISLLGAFPRLQGVLINLSYLVVATIIYWYWIPRPTFFKILLWLSLPLCAIALLQQTPLLSVPDLFLHRSHGLLNHPSTLGIIIAALLPLAVQHSKKGRWLFLLIYVATILASGSRSAVFLGLLAALWAWKPSLKLLLSCGAVLIVVITSILFLRPHNQQLDSIQARAYLWEASLEGIQQQPFLGYGPETQSLVLPDLIDKQYYVLEGESVIPDRSHNEALDIALTSGLPLLLIVIAALYFFPKTPSIWVLLGSLLIQVGTTPVYVLLWIFLAIALAEHEAKKQFPSPHPPVSAL